jgi:hypothetical protein
MDLNLLYSSLQTLPKDAMEIVFSYLRPDAQRKLGMTCCRFWRMFKESKNGNLPDLESLLANSFTKKSKNCTKLEFDKKIQRWQMWVDEAKNMGNNVYRWRWIHDSISLEILFLKIEYGYLITNILTKYGTNKDKDYSFAQFDIRPTRRRSWYIGQNNVHGPKYRNLPPHSLPYQKLATIIKSWISNDRARHLLNPVCDHTLNKRNNESLTFHIAKTQYYCLDCNQCPKI